MAVSQAATIARCTKSLGSPAPVAIARISLRTICAPNNGTGRSQPTARAKATSANINAPASSRGNRGNSSAKMSLACPTGVPDGDPRMDTASWASAVGSAFSTRPIHPLTPKLIRASLRHPINISPAGPSRSPARAKHTASRISDPGSLRPSSFRQATAESRAIRSRNKAQGNVPFGSRNTVSSVASAAPDKKATVSGSSSLCTVIQRGRSCRLMVSLIISLAAGFILTD